jgi:hypothetical protein
MTTISRETLDSIQTRLQELAETAQPEQLAYLAKALESVAGKTTAFDIAQLTDEKLQELVALTEDSLQQLQAAKEAAESALGTQKAEAEAALELEKTTILAEMEADILQNLSLLDTRKNEHLAAIAVAKEDLLETLATEMERFDEINDLPEGATLASELEKRSLIEPGALPFVFGILSRSEDYYGLGGLTTQLGSWTSVDNANSIMSLLCGCHNFETTYSAFFKPPQIGFLQGTNGVFMHKHLNTVYGYSTNQYYYSHACLGVVFVKNTTDADITKTLSFGGSCGYASGYNGAALFVGVPDENTTALTWTKSYSTTTAAAYASSTASITVPAQTTVAILLYTSGYYVTTSNSHYTTFLHWYLYNMRSVFLKDGLEIDVPKTLKAWQCPGYDDPIKLWDVPPTANDPTEVE